MYICECGKTYENKQAYVGHCGHCIIHIGRRPDERYQKLKGKWSWNKGKTKATDDRVRLIGEKIHARALNGLCEGHRQTEDAKKKLSIKAKYNATHHLNGWKAGSSKILNKYEVFTRDYLIEHNIQFEQEVTIPRSKFGKKCSYYQLDFIINGKVDLEIDGSSHTKYNKSHDDMRDSDVSQLYYVYRIKHMDSIDILKKKLDEFLIWLETKSET